MASTVAIATVLAGCGAERADPGSSPPATEGAAGRRSAPASDRGARVDMLDLRFAPLHIAVEPRQRITFVNRGRVTHNAKGAGFFTRVMEPGGEKSVLAPRRAGRHRYVCTFHPGMEATITVRAG